MKRFKNLLMRRKSIIILVLIIILAFFMRVCGLGDEELTLSEFITLQVASQPTLQRTFQAAQNEFHPPAYYLLIHAWGKIFSLSAFSLRLFSVILGLSSLTLAYSLVKYLFEEKHALIVTFILAILPLHVFFSTNASSYMFFFFVILLNMGSFVRFLRGPTAWNALLYGLSSAIMLYTHYFGIILLFSEGIYFLYFHLIHSPAYNRGHDALNDKFGRTTLIKGWVASQLLTLMLFAPYITRCFSDLLFYQQYPVPYLAKFSTQPLLVLNHVGMAFSDWFISISASKHYGWLAIPNTSLFERHSFNFLGDPWHILDIGLFLFCCAILFAFIVNLLKDKSALKEFRKNGKPVIMLFIILSVIPFVFCALFPSFYRSESFIFIVFFLFVSITYGLLSLKNKIVTAGFLIFVSLFFMAVFVDTSISKNFGPPFKETSELIKGNMGEGDLIIFYPQYYYTEFLYYYNPDASSADWDWIAKHYEEKVIYPPRLKMQNLTGGGDEQALYITDFGALEGMIGQKDVWFVFMRNIFIDESGNLMGFFNKHYKYNCSFAPRRSLPDIDLMFFSNHRQLSCG